ncbi:cytochrome c oxidase subunit 5A, mitochondrial [Podarcis lilfordi]|uniref:Cytochrome c oxidase subunit 5A, mitochondrial n=1 Tax=Podarcis lilfordi TaxID=74358 RepID=A0AA35KSP6_9SAUR|nr:cytochrome c oxidase subunit 5A, mitochondrial [Podarcis lilfordi]
MARGSCPGLSAVRAAARLRPSEKEEEPAAPSPRLRVRSPGSPLFLPRRRRPSRGREEVSPPCAAVASAPPAFALGASRQRSSSGAWPSEEGSQEAGQEQKPPQKPPPRRPPPPPALPSRASPHGRRFCVPSAMLAAAQLLLSRRCAAPVLRGLVPRAAPAAVLPVRCYSHGSHESDEEFDARWVTYFNKPDIDAWELRKGMNTLVGYDLVPEPKIIDAALRACRRLNDFASAVRILEVVKDKAGPHKEIYPYVIQELRPTLNELGISTPEELGLDKV